ncbi:hypothetical protein HOG48_05855 [Candidatus Peregrinibacteria bacterium]|jgi:hypothetical protein|nr:hypothetical protein [Candidatus Peregrinibacteria bacterium]
MTDMDVKVIPNEGSAGGGGFDHHEIGEHVEKVESPGEAEVTTLVKMKFPNFAKLVATHSFEDILERNKDGDVIIPADLLADLANADLVDDENKRRVILVLGGVVLGVLLAFVFLGGA